MMVLMVNSDSQHATSLIEKLSGAKPRSILPLTKGEMELYRSDDFQVLHMPEQGEHPLIKVEPGARYVAIAGINTNIDDLLLAQERLGIEISIVREYGSS